MLNKKVIIKNLPDGKITSQIFDIQQGEVIDINNGEVLGQTLWLSMEPAIFGKLRPDEHYTKLINIGETVQCFGIAQVIESKSKRLQKGDIFFGEVGMQEYCVMNDTNIRKINPYLFPIEYNLSLFGISGLTAYLAIKNIIKPQKDSTIVISAAAGGVGSIAGQIVKLMGANAVAIVGTDEKAKYVKDKLGYNKAVNYKSKTFVADLLEACNKGIDGYLDSVGGNISVALLPLYNAKARIAVCGRMALQNLNNQFEDIGIRDHTTIIRKRLIKQGFLLSDYESEYSKAIFQLLYWYKNNHIKIEHDIYEGIDSTIDALLGLLEGNNYGKRLVKVANLPLNLNNNGKFAASIINNKLFPIKTISRFI